ALKSASEGLFYELNGWFGKKHLWKLEDEVLPLENLPYITPKTKILVKLVQNSFKSVILCSYIDMVKQIEQQLIKSGKRVFILTGRSADKNKVLEEFKHSSKSASLVISPVGERDLDIPQADLLIIYDVVNTVKTVYQRLKRIRKGKIIILCYEDTSEEKKVSRLLENMVRRYPWSIKLNTTLNAK
ncbi:MAG: helicase-related protein, partial [Candidatus Hodarchaeota archaeon]